MRALIFFFLVGWSAIVTAQSTNITTLFQSDLRKGELFYQQLAYANALNFFMRVAEKNPSNKEALDKIADCHLRLGNYEDAALWLQKVVDHPAVKPIDHFRNGQVLSMLGKYEEAMAAYQKYEAASEADPRGREKVAFLKQLPALVRDSAVYTVTNEWFNSNQADFSPVFYKDGIVFVSARDRDLFIKRKSLSATNEKEALLNAFFVLPNYDSAQTELAQIRLFYHKHLNSSYHDGPVCFFDNGKRIAFTRNILRDNQPVKDEKGRINLELYFARLTSENELTAVVPFEHNSIGHTVAHPWVSEDGKLLYFSSDKPGGMGGADLYVSQLTAGKWSVPQNLGPPVNTAGDEFYPFLSGDSLLFFASNGHGGFGGLDNFVSTLLGSTYTAPQNLAFPVNSALDDFGLIVAPNGREGIFASNRPGGRGYDDIYSYKLNYFKLVGKVVERESKSIIPDAMINVVDSLGQVVATAVSDQQGNFDVRLPFDQHFDVSASKQGYTSLDKLQVSTHQAGMVTDTLAVSIWKHNLDAAGVVYSNESQQPLSGVAVRLENLTKGSVQEVITGADGQYQFDVTPNNQYRLQATKPGFLPEGFSLNTAGLYRGHLLNDLVLEEEFLEKFEVFFEFDKKDVRSEFTRDLDKIVKDLKRAPAATLHIAAHADAQGKEAYNQRLSEARAKEVQKYMIARGIALARIEAVGFGEELVLNRCSEGVECTDEEHAKNRRAEIKIQLPRADKK